MADFREYSWDDEIQSEDAFTLLDAGDYEFEIVKFERARHEGSEKIPPCNKAVVTFKVGGTALTENFLLCSTLEWKLSQLFLSVGLKRHGEPLRMNWQALPGKRGVCKVIVHKYMKDGSEREINRIDKLYAYDEQPVNFVRLATNVGNVGSGLAPTSTPTQTGGFAAPPTATTYATQPATPTWNGGSFGGNWQR